MPMNRSNNKYRQPRSMRAKRNSRRNELRDEKIRKFKEHEADFIVDVVDIGPESTCECCEHNAAAKLSKDDAFDENGYPKIKKTMFGSRNTALDNDAFDEQGYPIKKNSLLAIKPLSQLAPSWINSKAAPRVSMSKAKSPFKPFRLLDLPAELRNRIYELVVASEAQPICVNDTLLRPVTSKRELQQDMETMLLHCTADLVCVPCQLHAAIGTGCFALSGANKQIHSETALTTYKVNHFSLHNLYYLQAFLTIIGKDARQSIKSLRFDWKLPEDEVHATKTYANFRDSYRLLLDCKLLTTLWVDMDVVNLLSWGQDGKRCQVVKRDMSETRAIELMYDLRGLREIRVRWKHVEGLEMDAWVKAVMGVWRLPHGRPASDFTPVDVETTMQEGLWCCVFWKAGAEELCGSE